MRGEYQDTLLNQDGQVVTRLSWRSNTIVESAWPLLAGLFGSRPDFKGILYCAYGTGDPAWDNLPEGGPAPNPASSQLQQEVQRVRIRPGGITYIDANGQPTDQPSPRIAVTVLLRWQGASPTALREFGLVGGDASEAANTGLLINYVTHEPITLQPGMLLQRTIRLAFGSAALPATAPDTPPPPPPPEEWDPFSLLEIPDHHLGKLPVSALRELGDAAKALDAAGIETIFDFVSQPEILSDIQTETARLIDLRTRSLTVLQSAATFRRASDTVKWADMTEMNIDEVLSILPEELADKLGIDFEVVLLAQTILGPMRLSLLVSSLRGINIGELVER